MAAPVEKSDEGALVCGNCGHVNEPNAVVCGKCGRTLEMELPPSPGEQQPPVDAGVFYSQFSPYVGIAPDSTMDGQPVMDIATFVGPNAAYYMARFHFLRLQRTKMSWNWAAAFFPVEWLLYRKMNRSFWIVFALSLVLALPYLLLTFLTLRAVIADPGADGDFFSLLCAACRCLPAGSCFSGEYRFGAFAGPPGGSWLFWPIISTAGMFSAPLKKIRAECTETALLSLRLVPERRNQPPSGGAVLWGGFCFDHSGGFSAGCRSVSLTNYERCVSSVKFQKVRKAVIPAAGWVPGCCHY